MIYLTTKPFRFDDTTVAPVKAGKDQPREHHSDDLECELLTIIV